MRYLAILLFAVMAIGLTVCGCLLWQKREATGDRSRTLLALTGWAAAFVGVLYIFRTCAGTLPVSAPLLAPEQVFFPYGWLMLLLLYPLELIQPVGSRSNLYLRMFAPLALMLILGICGGVTYTPLLSVDEVWQHIGRADVAFRLLALAVLPFYGFRLCRVRYRWEETYTDKVFLRLFASALCLMGLLQIAVQLTLSYGLFLLQGVVWMLFFFGITWYELRERLWVRRANKNLNNK